MTPIANCKVEFTFQCPKLWSKLKKTKDLNVRFCNVCSRNVHLCNSLEEVHRHASHGNCIAVPPTRGEREHLMGEPLPPPYENPTHPREEKEEKGQA